MTTLTEIVAQFDEDISASKSRKIDQNKALAARLRQIKSRLPSQQQTALDAEIARLDPTE